MMNKSYDTNTRKTLTTPVGGVVSGKFYAIGNFFGCAVSTVTAAQAATGKKFTLDREGTWNVPVEAVAGNAITEGEAIYWKAGRANAEFTNDPETGEILVGYADDPVAAGTVATIDVSIEPMAIIAPHA